MSTFDPIFSCTYSVQNCLPTIDGGLAEVEEDPEMSAHDDFLVDFNNHTHGIAGSFPTVPAAVSNLPEGYAEKFREYLREHMREGVYQTINTTSTAFPQPTGWICPRCQLCLAPSQVSCARCAPAYVPLAPNPFPAYPYPYPLTPVEPIGPTWTSDSITFHPIEGAYSIGSKAIK